jgi:glucose-specific phosphotransferase system IIA component
VSTVASPLTGRVVPLEDVPDEVFAERIMGDGVAIAPTEGAVVAPVAGTIEKLFPGGHGIALQTADGLQVLIHVGLETVRLKGDGFTVHAAQGDTVAVGDLLVTVDLARLAELEVDTISPVVVISGQPARVVAEGTVSGGQPLLEV